MTFIMDSKREITTSPATLSDMYIFAGSRAKNWIRSLYELRVDESSIPLESLLQCLIGIWVCEMSLSTDTDKQYTQYLASDIQRRLDFNELDVFSILLRSDAATVLVSSGILRAMDCKSKSIELFIREVASNISSNENQCQEAQEFFDIRHLLYKLNISSDMEIHEMELPLNSSEIGLFQSDETTIRSIASRIAAATMYGQRYLLAEPELLNQLEIVIPVLMLYYLHQYNLDMGTLLLRSMNYLHLQMNLAFNTGLNFVLAQQHPNGYFGYFASEVSQIQSTRPRFDAMLELYLPITISCLWTIAEATKQDFVLFNSI